MRVPVAVAPGGGAMAVVAVRMRQLFWIEDLIETVEAALADPGGAFSVERASSAIAAALSATEALIWFRVQVTKQGTRPPCLCRARMARSVGGGPARSRPLPFWVRAGDARQRPERVKGRPLSLPADGRGHNRNIPEQLIRCFVSTPERLASWRPPSPPWQALVSSKIDLNSDLGESLGA